MSTTTLCLTANIIYNISRSILSLHLKMRKLRFWRVKKLVGISSRVGMGSQVYLRIKHNTIIYSPIILSNYLDNPIKKGLLSFFSEWKNWSSEGLSSGLAKKFIRVFPSHRTEKPEQTFWPTNTLPSGHSPVMSRAQMRTQTVYDPKAFFSFQLLILPCVP